MLSSNQDNVGVVTCSLTAKGLLPTGAYQTDVGQLIALNTLWNPQLFRIPRNTSSDQKNIFSIFCVC